MRRAYFHGLVAAIMLACLAGLSSLTLAQGIPDPAHCTVAELNGPGTPCHYRFGPAPLADQMQIFVELADINGVPIPNWETRISLGPGPNTTQFCTCVSCPDEFEGFTNQSGQVTFLVHGHFGGRGLMRVTAESRSGPNFEVGFIDLPFTSPDLNGSCQQSPQASTNVVDLGIWAGGLPPNYSVSSDFNCSGSPVNVVDLGYFASFGLGIGCPVVCP